MAYQGQSRLIEDHPIGSNLDVFCDSFTSLCKDRTIFHSPDPLAHFTHEDIQNLALDLLSLLRKLPVILFLQSKTGHGPLRNDLLKLISAVASDEFDFDRVKPLLKSALADELDDALIWKHLYDAVTESTPPPRPIPSSIQQTPLSQNTSGLVNSSEFRQDVDPILKFELGPLYAGLPNFHKVFFGAVSDLDRVSKTVFRRSTLQYSDEFTEVRVRVERRRRDMYVNRIDQVVVEDDGGICRMARQALGWSMEHPYLTLLEAKRTFKHVPVNNATGEIKPVVSKEALAQCLGEASCDYLEG